MKKLEKIYIIVDKNNQPYKTHEYAKHGGIIAVYRTEKSAKENCDFLNEVWNWPDAYKEDTARLPLRATSAFICVEDNKNDME